MMLMPLFVTVALGGGGLVSTMVIIMIMIMMMVVMIVMTMVVLLIRVLMLMLVLGVLRRQAAPGGCQEPEFGRGHTSPQHALGRHVGVLDREASQSGAQTFERHAQIEQRTQDHVA